MAKAAKSAPASRTDPAVDALLADLAHPLAAEIAAVRKLMLSIAPEITEGVKWNAPSFWLTDWFATVNLRSRDSLQLILHRGAKVKADGKALTLDDPKGLAKFLAPDRCLVTAGMGKSFTANRAALEALLRVWVRQLQAQHGRGAHMAAKPKNKVAATASDVDAESVLTSLRVHASKKTLEEMGPRYGVVTTRALGVSMDKIQLVAKPLAYNHRLAADLWATGWYEARMLASLIDDPALVTPAQMDRWCKDFDNWGIVDTVCFKLFDQTPHALAMVKKWSKREPEFEKRAAFALLACMALHDPPNDDAIYLECLPLVEKAARDDRNFVRKAVSWALRAIGGRSPALYNAVLDLAERQIDSGHPTARSIGKEALRDLSKTTLAKRLKRNSGNRS